MLSTRWRRTRPLARPGRNAPISPPASSKPLSTYLPLNVSRHYGKRVSSVWQSRGSGGQSSLAIALETMTAKENAELSSRPCPFARQRRDAAVAVEKWRRQEWASLDLDAEPTYQPRACGKKHKPTAMTPARFQSLWQRLTGHPPARSLSTPCRRLLRTPAGLP